MNAAALSPTELLDRFPAVLAQLAQPEAFPFAVPPGEPEVIQTHASAVLLVGQRAYKLKKPRDFGFFDFSTPELRRTYCMREVALNARLAPSIYLGVAPVLSLPDGRLAFGGPLTSHLVPRPGTRMDSGTVVDYAVVMVRLPEEATLHARVAAGSATAQLLRQVAHHVSAFHGRAPTNAHIASFGALDVIRRNWDENFEQMRPYIGRLFDQETFAEIEAYVAAFLRNRIALFEHRVQNGHIRDCHGDLRLQHVYALGPEEDPGRRLAIIDCIEFNERFRYGDVAAEVAFLVMELEYAGRTDLANAFLDTYLEGTGDEAMRELLPFYLCYRACVRGKVQAFQVNELEVSPGQRDEAAARARELFELARRYAHGRTQPAVVMVGGTMGAGKTALASRLHHALGWPLSSSDEVRKRLARIEPTQPVAEAFARGIYSPQWTERTYHALLDATRATLDEGRSVLLDATYGRRAFRLAVAELAHQRGAYVAFVECGCAPEVAKARLAERWRARASSPPTGMTPSGRPISDGRPELYDAQAAAWERYEPTVEADIAHIPVSTVRPHVENVAHVIAALGKAMGCEVTLEADAPRGDGVPIPVS